MGHKYIFSSDFHHPWRGKISKAEIKRDLKFSPWRKGDQEAKKYFIILIVVLIVFSVWAAFIFIYLLIEDPSKNLIFLVIMGVIWAIFGLFLMFQVRYAYRVKNLLKDVHHKAFKRKRLFSKGEPVDVVHKGLRSILKKEKIYITKEESKFRVPEIGKFRHNLYLKKLGIRIIIKRNTTLLPGDGSILLVPEKTSKENLDGLKDSIEEAFE